MKYCSKCGFHGEEHEFSKKTNICKCCMRVYQKEYSVQNKEQIKEYRRLYREENKKDIPGKVIRPDNHKKCRKCGELKDKIVDYHLIDDRLCKSCKCISKNKKNKSALISKKIDKTGIKVFKFRIVTKNNKIRICEIRDRTLGSAEKWLECKKEVKDGEILLDVWIGNICIFEYVKE